MAHTTKQLIEHCYHATLYSVVHTTHVAYVFQMLKQIELYRWRGDHTMTSSIWFNEKTVIICLIEQSLRISFVYVHFQWISLRRTRNNHTNYIRTIIHCNTNISRLQNDQLPFCIIYLCISVFDRTMRWARTSLLCVNEVHINYSNW